MTLFSKWFAAALISTSLVFAAPSAEAKKKTKTHASHTHKKKSAKKKKHTAHKSEPRSPGYARASEYMKADRAPASAHKVKKHKKTAKKKARKHRA